MPEGTISWDGGRGVYDGWRRWAAFVLTVGFSVATSPVVGSSDASADQGSWTPSQAPLPTASLPDGGTADAMDLSSTSCSSSSFCVAVGWVSDGNDNSGYIPRFPLAETYSAGSWTPTVLPMPSDAVNYLSSLTSVSCASEGSCAAVGTYYGVASEGWNQNGLLEELSDGEWSATAAPLPNGPGSALVNLNSVSCSDAVTCVAVGAIADDETGAQSGVIYSLNSDVWQLQQAPMPSDTAYINMTSVSCPDDGDCVAVGYYEPTNDNASGLIFTLASGIWGYVVAPTPTNQGTGSTPDVAINAVDCPEVGWCEAGGFYVDTNDNVQPLLLQLDSGSWTPLQAPVPANSQTNTLAGVNGMYCPAVGSCVATGFYWTDWPLGGENGLILTESSGSWIAASAPLPSGPSNSPKDEARLGSDSAGSSGSVSLAGVACGSGGFCAATGSDGVDGLIETTTFSGLPSVDSVSPASGPVAGGSLVTINGSNFGADSLAYFGGVTATTTFVNSTELEATAPASAVAEPVDITVGTGGLETRAKPADEYSYYTSGTAPTIVSAANTTFTSGTACTVTVHTNGDPTPTMGETGALPSGVTFTNDGDGTATLAGTPPAPAAGRYQITIIAHSGIWAPAYQIFTINLGPFAITTTSLPPGKVWTKANKAKYSATLTAGAGTPPYTWALASGALPPGLTLNTSGVISGKANKAGTYRFKVKVTDAKTGNPPESSTAKATLSIKIS